MSTALGAVWSLASHVSILFPLFVCYQLRDIYAVTKLSLTLIVSLFYHACRDANWCLLGATQEMWRRADHVYADTTILLVLFFIAVDVALEKTSWMSGGNVQFLIVTEMTVTALATIVIFLSIGPTINAALVVASSCAALFISRLQWIEWSYVSGRIDSIYFYAGLGLTAVAFGIFIGVPDTSDYYQIAHGFWHYIVFAAIGLLKIGTTRHVRQGRSGWLGLGPILLLKDVDACSV